MARTQGLSLAVVGKAGVFSDLGVYGRVGTVTGPAAASPSCRGPMAASPTASV
jgi:hypothetical protein